MTASSYSTYLHEKGSVFPAILPKLTNFKLGTKKFLTFLFLFFDQLKHIIAGRQIQNGCFFDSLFFTRVITQYRSTTATISTDILLVLGMTPNCANTISEHGQGHEEFLGKELSNSPKLRKVVAIYKTSRLVLSRQ